jgi:hypothetical protein
MHIFFEGIELRRDFDDLSRGWSLAR